MQKTLNSRLVEKDVESICSTAKNVQIDLLPFSLDAKNSMTSCKSLGGQMFVPESKSDNEAMMKDFNRNSPILQKMVEKSCGPERNIWVPIFKMDDSWVHFDNRSKPMTSVGDKVVVNGNDLQNCAYYKAAIDYFGDDRCSLKFCTFCAWEKKIQFTLRGLCLKSTVEDYYVLTSYLFFNGLMG